MEWLDYFRVAVIGSGAVAVAFIFVSNMMRKDLKVIKEDDDEDKKFMLKIKEYETAYYDDFNDLTEKDHTSEFLIDLRNCFTEEETPYGDIIMCYNSDSQTFMYWSNRRSVPYKILDSVARQYAIEYDCKSICINYKDEYDKAKNIEEENYLNSKKIIDTYEDDDSEEMSKKQKKKSVFASFKSYNLKKKNVSNKKRYILMDNANRFVYKGRRDDWIDPQTFEAEKNKVYDPKANLNFESYKKLVADLERLKNE